jgi:hypothetical protein
VIRRKWSKVFGQFTYDGVTPSRCQCPGSLPCTCGEGKKERAEQNLRPRIEAAMWRFMESFGLPEDEDLAKRLADAVEKELKK